MPKTNTENTKRSHSSLLSGSTNSDASLEITHGENTTNVGEEASPSKIPKGNTS